MTASAVILRRSPALGTKPKNLWPGSLINSVTPLHTPCRCSHTQRFFAPAERTPPGSE
jgi:hypothetical protein